MAQQVWTLAAVAVGSALTFLAGFLTERSRWRRQHAVRWDERRVEVYAEYARALREWTTLGQRLAAGHGLDHPAQPLDPAEGYPQLAAAQGACLARWEAVLLLGDEATMAAAHAWQRQVYQLVGFARGLRDDPAAFQRLRHAIGVARRDFYLAARADMGVPGFGFAAPLICPPYEEADDDPAPPLPAPTSPTGPLPLIAPPGDPR
ncbi:hypothetical protein GCM10010123_05890 [Pilimelia anulata]|uniref:Secreted protein n=1 Tax=Pilimelia anulata TaxID=53371 RepID=A0A8J3B6T9_9ACTN|nr:hypothetical protein [Pilimelia anulata]GGJ78780.1 hypothetical protein GCM10010123_05890 [Pilimelia anulata]